MSDSSPLYFLLSERLNVIAKVIFILYFYFRHTSF